ncbi:MAG: tRNA pseudouridine(38-40) synthase TruA [Eggerthellaceae bacterium]|nr:tRNA pseudouridine(38-40) synthase TruA [Eggerthellaceae bacterium]
MSETNLHTLALTVAYRGAAFSGFARQPEQLTVQGELENALAILLRRPVETTCAGRTDTGVHARGQVVSFDVTAEELDEFDLRDVNRARFASLKRSLNAITHEDIAVRAIRQEADGFSARFDAVAREYRYFLAVGTTPPVLMRDFAWFVPGSAEGLDVEAMYRASRCLIGEQDFKSFCRASSAEGKPTCRNLMEVSFSTEEVFGEELLVVRVVGSSFLHSMVRTIVGTLVEVGRGQQSEQWVAQALEARDRTAAGECAPAQGLVFWEVRYE